MITYKNFLILKKLLINNFIISFIAFNIYFNFCNLKLIKLLRNGFEKNI